LRDEEMREEATCPSAARTLPLRHIDHYSDINIDIDTLHPYSPLPPSSSQHQHQQQLNDGKRISGGKEEKKTRKPKVATPLAHKSAFLTVVYPQ
jgi:hypothetical protein